MARATAAGAAADDPITRADYQNVLAVWKQYVEVRFKLLTLVPVATGIGVGLTAENLSAATALVAGFVLIAIYGIVMYDLRNSLLHDAAVHRLKEIEKQLELPKHTHTIAGGAGGLFNERPEKTPTLAGVLIWHDRALNLVYSSSFGAWATLLAASLTTVFEEPASEDRRWLFAFLVGLVGTVAAYYAIQRAGESGDAVKGRMAGSTATS